ncbi:hypothetical protein ABXS75_19565 [Roseburia hominis]
MRLSRKEANKNTGDLREELKEFRKLIPEEGGSEMSATHTAKCGVFLTIYCC